MKTKELLKEFGVAELIKLKGNSMGEYLKDNISNIIYLSSYIEGNPLDEETSKLLFDGQLMRGKGKLEDYLEMINHTNAAKKLLSLGNKEITSKDAIDLRRILFHNILGVYTEGFRRFRNDAGYLITIPVEEVAERAKKSIAILNRKGDSIFSIFSNASDFHVKFSPIHPFEDGVGRTTRLLQNLYLIRHNMRPLLLEATDVKKYVFSLSVFEFSNHTDAWDLTFTSILAKDSKNAISEKIYKLDPVAPDQLAFKTALLQLFGNTTKNEIKKIVPRLYNNPEKDESLSIIALWMIGNEKADSPIIKEALDDERNAVRAVGILAAREIENLEYVGKIKDLAINDKSPTLRLLSIAVLADLKKLDKPLIEQVLDKEQDEAVLTRLSKCLIAIDKSQISLEKIESLMGMKSLSIKRRSYAAYIAHADVQNISNMIIKSIEELPEVVIDGIIAQLEKSKKINDRQISKQLSNIAIKNSYIRRQLLAVLALHGNFNEDYQKIMEATLMTNKSDERAYSIYLLGTKLGTKYLSDKFGMQIGAYKTTEENIAGFLIYAGELENAADAKKATKPIFAIEDAKVNFVEMMEINRMINENKFGNDFLLLYQKESQKWIG